MGIDGRQYIAIRGSQEILDLLATNGLVTKDTPIGEMEFFHIDNMEIGNRSKNYLVFCMDYRNVPIYDQLERLLKQYPTCWIKYDFSEELGNCGMWIGRFQRGQPQIQKMEWRELTIEELHHETDFSKSYSSDEV